MKMSEYYCLVIPIGNKRDTKTIGKQIKENTIASSWLGTYEDLEYGDMQPCKPVGIKVIDNPDWLKRF
jgi:hypothetical protein